MSSPKSQMCFHSSTQSGTPLLDMLHLTWDEPSPIFFVFLYKDICKIIVQQNKSSLLLLFIPRNNAIWKWKLEKIEGAIKNGQTRHTWQDWVHKTQDGGKQYKEKQHIEFKKLSYTDPTKTELHGSHQSRG
jgi:hypothetical protein